MYLKKMNQTHSVIIQCSNVHAFWRNLFVECFYGYRLFSPIYSHQLSATADAETLCVKLRISRQIRGESDKNVQSKEFEPICTCKYFTLYIRNVQLYGKFLLLKRDLNIGVPTTYSYASTLLTSNSLFLNRKFFKYQTQTPF